MVVFRFQATHALLDLGPSGGVPGPEADLRLWGEDGTVKIHLDGGSGDIRLAGADCAEDFDADESQQFDPGSVMTIGVGGRIRPCTEAYDHRVAGVVSGAGGFRSGILMDSRHGQRRTPVAVSGKVEIRPMMYIALSYDHRIVDGQQAVLFLVRIKELMEDPAAMLID